MALSVSEVLLHGVWNLVGLLRFMFFFFLINSLIGLLN